jgi:magnesium chelatase family protein
MLKVSRTIADMEGCENIQSQHVSEAVNYRTLERSLE